MKREREGGEEGNSPAPISSSNRLVVRGEGGGVGDRKSEGLRMAGFE